VIKPIPSIFAGLDSKEIMWGCWGFSSLESSIIRILWFSSQLLSSEFSNVVLPDPVPPLITNDLLSLIIFSKKSFCCFVIVRDSTKLISERTSGRWILNEMIDPGFEIGLKIAWSLIVLLSWASTKGCDWSSLLPVESANCWASDLTLSSLRNESFVLSKPFPWSIQTSL